MDELPSGDKAVYVYLEFIALGFALEAVAAFARGESWHKSAGLLALSAVFLLAGIKWPKIKQTIITVPYLKYLRWMTRAFYAILAVSLVAVSIVAYVEWKQASLAWKQLFGAIQTIAKTTAPAPSAASKPTISTVQTVEKEPKITLARATILPRGSLGKYEAQSIVQESQRYAAEILNCLLSENYEGQCIGLYGTRVTGVRDDLHNQGIEFAELNASVNNLESKPSVVELKHAALILRAVADQLLVMTAPAPPSPSKALPEPPKEEEHHHDALPDKAIFILPNNRLNEYGVRLYESYANSAATGIRVCLTDQGKKYQENRTQAALTCNSRYADSVATVVNGLRDAGVYVESLPDARKRMEKGADYDELEYIADLMELVGQELGKRQ